MKNDCPTIYLASEAAGGVARHVIDLYSGLTQRGWSARIIFSPTRLEPMYKTELRNIPTSHLFSLPMRRGPHWTDLKAMSRLHKYFRTANGPSILHAHSTKAGVLGAALRPWIKNSIYTPHAYRSVDPTLSPIRRRVIQAVERTFSKTYDRIIAVAPAEYDYAIHLGIEAQRVRHISNGIRIPNRTAVQPKLHLANKEKGLTLGFVGRLAPQKNPILFLKVLQRIAGTFRGVRAIIAGDGPLRSELQAYAIQSNIADRIEWRGVVPFSSVYHEMDLMVHTSFYEGMPYSLIESAGYHLPIISTKNDGSIAILEELLPEAIVDSFDEKEIAGKIITLCSSPEAIKRQAEGLARVADRFSVDRMVEAIEKEYKNLLR